MRLVLIGLASGFLGALLGVGGGIVIVPLLLLVANFELRPATATSLAAIGFTALAGTIVYAIHGELRPLYAVLVVGLFAQPLVSLLKDWWSLPEAGHGLLLAPVAIWLGWRSGIRSDARPDHKLGIAIILFAVLLRYVSGLAAEMFTMRASMLIAMAGVPLLLIPYSMLREQIHSRLDAPPEVTRG